MEYLISFLEGIITFISPCLLPLIPIYVLYFGGGDPQNKTRQTLIRSLGFVLGFSLVFILLGAFAGGLGGLLIEYRRAVDLITGAIVVLFGLGFMGVIKFSLFGKGAGGKDHKRPQSFGSSVLFGSIFAVGWTPCVGAFLGSALLMASQKGSVLQGIILLLFYCAGLGIPFVLSAVLIDRLKGAFDWIKRHYDLINKVCGALLVAVGALMMSGLMGALLGQLS